MKKLLTILIILTILFCSIPNPTGKNNTKSNLNILNNPNFSKENISFTLKMRINMRLARMKSISTCIIKNNSVAWSNNYGFADRLLLKKPTKETLYMIGSITKVVTATAIMQLLENESHDFDLDDNVSKWLPFDLKNPNHPDINITFRMLLSHQSSLLGHGLSELKYLFSHNHYSYIKEIILPNGSDYHPEYWANYKPGEKANYSNLGFILIGCIIEEMTNTSYEKYCQKNIFEPLEMYNTSFTLDESDKHKLAVPYFFVGGFYHRIPKTDFKFLDPAGGIYTNTEDLAHLLITHLNNGKYKNTRILENQSIEEMHKIQYPENKIKKHNMRYGLGWIVYVDDTNKPTFMGHGGDLICFHSNMLTLISENVSVIYFVNSAPMILYTKIPGIFYKIFSKATGNIINLLFNKGISL